MNDAENLLLVTLLLALPGGLIGFAVGLVAGAYWKG